METTDGGRRLAQVSVALTVHGPAGAVDLVVPPEASVDDVAREYAAKAGLQFAPALHTRLGQVLDRRRSLGDLGVRSGAMLAAGGAVRRHAGDLTPVAGEESVPGKGSAAWFVVAAGVAALAGWFAAWVGGLDAPQGRVAIAVLAGSALVGVLPVGRLSGHRRVAAPAFAAAAAFAGVWAPEPERLPTVVGVTALVAAVAAAVARALDGRGDEALRVWILVGVGLFLVTGAGALLRTDPQVVWSVLLVAATLAARLVPAVAIDVPDQFLLDLERLAVTAWSARDRPQGRRGRMVVPSGAVAHVAARGAQIVTASAAAVWLLVAVAAPMLLATATLPVDRIGARVMVAASGAALLLAARSYRHTTARVMLRGAGLTCWAALIVVVLRFLDTSQSLTLGAAGVLVAVVMVVVAIATGRGWRSAWWSRRAEVAEGLAGAATIAALVVAAGWFRALWEIKFRV